MKKISLGLILLLSPIAGTAWANPAALNAPTATSQFYTDNSAKIVWAEPSTFEALLSAIKGLEAHGLNPADYHYETLKSGGQADMARDRLATDAWFSAAAHMLYGKLDATSVEPDWTAAKRDADLKAALQKALASGTIANSLEQFAPQQPDYSALKEELANLKTQALTPQTIIPPGVALKINMESSRTALLKLRLFELGYLTSAPNTAIFDEATLDAVKAFQNDAELDADGVIGSVSLSVLNRSLNNKINQIRVNMERWRWLPNDLGKRHLRANIAGFNVTAWNDGVPEQTHLTIVGKTYRKTPVFSDQVEYLVFYPWWETPNSLATRDKLPLFRKDPGAVERLGFQIIDKQGQIVPAASIDWALVSPTNFPYRIRQKPGDLNALGQVKIMFPNIHNVYLHDTPTKGLFAQRQRAFSSGCLRTENPLELSAWLLSQTADWNRARIDTTVASGKETRVSLSKPVPVHILYFTAVNEGSAGIRYLDDIYDRDGKVLSGLNAKPRTH